jgi:hypothetical protein
MPFGQQLIAYAVQFLLTFLFISGTVTRIIKFVLRRVFHSGNDTAAVMTFVIANVVIFGLLFMGGGNVGSTFEADDVIQELTLIVWLILDWTVLPKRTKTKDISKDQ